MAGQSAYLRDLIAIVRDVPLGLGAGILWWEPARLPGVDWSPEDRNAWGNLTLFAPDGRALPSLHSFETGG